MINQRLNEAVARKFGYNGPADSEAVDKFLMSKPESIATVRRALNIMKPTTAMAEGGDTETTATTTPVEPDDVPTKTPEEMAEEVVQGQRQMVRDAFVDPQALVAKPEVAKLDPAAAGTTIDPTAGQITAPLPQAGQPDFFTQIQQPPRMPSTSPSGVAKTTTAATPEPITPETVDAKTASGEVTTALADVDPVTGTVSDKAQVTAATMDPATTGVKDLTSAQGEAVVMTNPVQREIQDGELVSGAADATKAAAFTEQVQAATATPSEKATVQGQLSTLMTQFEGDNTPAWAAGAMRAATAAMAARGLGASSMAGQAVVQAAMESALPVAMADAQTQATFEAQNLSNRQQRAMLAAQQRATFMGQEFDQAFQARVSNAAKISDVANMNFTAEQQVALENSRNANTINMANLTNKQAMVLAEASAIAQLEAQNLSNQQQAAVQNANSFLQMDMSNMNNAQQTSMFKAQSVVQSLLTDQAAENATRQFNASSENQTKQFMANLNTQVTQFNAAQANAISQFNAGETNALDKFNASMQEQRNQFNAQNGLVVAQANAQWRQNVDTLNTAAQNEANMINAATVNTFTKATVDQIWQRERDLMDYAFKGTEQEKDRMVNIMLGEKQISQYQTQAEQNRKSNEDTAKYSLLTQLILS